MEDIIKASLEKSIKIKQDILSKGVASVVHVANIIQEALVAGGKIFLCGNGGSAADSQHIAAEFVGRFQKDRKAIPAIALTTDTSALTALANDYGYHTVFVRQVEALGKKGDVLWSFSTSGKSKNVIEAIKKAKEKGLKTVSFTGCGGGEIASLTDCGIVVPSENTARIQEVHICLAHIICEIIENTIG